MSCFQCDLCVFGNIHKRDPTPIYGDKLAMCCIRLANLAALWSRERSTDLNNLRLMRRGVEFNLATDQMSMYPELGPMPLDDVWGHSVVIQMLFASRRKGRYHADHSQYETVHKYRAAFSNVWHAASVGAGCFHPLDGSQQEWRVCLALVVSHGFRMVQEIRQGFEEKDGARCEASVGFFD
jgi:hypothetical protein